MTLAIFNTTGTARVKREEPLIEQLLKFNLGGSESNPKIIGNGNAVNFGTGYKKEEDTTLLRKAGAQVGRILEGGTDIVVSPAKWLAHMQENWLIYLVCTTILVVCGFLIYCCIRRKMSPYALYSSASGKPNFSSMVMDEAVKLATFHRALQGN